MTSDEKILELMIGQRRAELETALTHVNATIKLGKPLVSGTPEELKSYKWDLEHTLKDDCG